MKRTVKSRKLLVASVGVATVLYACEKKDPYPPGNLMAPVPALDAAPAPSETAPPTSGNLMPPPEPSIQHPPGNLMPPPPPEPVDAGAASRDAGTKKDAGAPPKPKAPPHPPGNLMPPPQKL
ncbi:MAG: hypothetical protein JNM74_27355 [Myxococcales bacterium]|jgi:hypothetical protein|nr:hypothetical protein [Myxococcales bacterium]